MALNCVVFSKHHDCKLTLAFLWSHQQVSWMVHPFLLRLSSRGGRMLPSTTCGTSLPVVYTWASSRSHACWTTGPDIQHCMHHFAAPWCPGTSSWTFWPFFMWTTPPHGFHMGSQTMIPSTRSVHWSTISTSASVRCMYLTGASVSTRPSVPSKGGLVSEFTWRTSLRSGGSNFMNYTTAPCLQVWDVLCRQVTQQQTTQCGDALNAAPSQQRIPPVCRQLLLLSTACWVSGCSRDYGVRNSEEQQSGHAPGAGARQSGEGHHRLQEKGGW